MTGAERRTAAELADALASGETTSVALTKFNSNNAATNRPQLAIVR